jgi:3,4-dihydroxy 2-butanone 4-phosphate synthase/GTP cyclohydrolase II
VTTGISAQDRARTVQAAVAPEARAEDLRQPGHIFPLMARPGGVLTRAGHTEAGCDLARLAGFEPAAVIVEILNEDGTMARRPELERFARGHGLAIGTIADLIRYRLAKESSIECVADREVETEAGSFRMRWYEDRVHGRLHVALVRGEPGGVPPLVRVHVRDTPRDLIGIRGEHTGWTLGAALRRIALEPHGIVVVLRPEELPEDIIGAGARDGGADSTGGAVLRTYGIGAQILRDLGVRQMRLLTNNPKKIIGLEGYGLEVVERVPIEMVPTRRNRAYLATKRDKLGHLLTLKTAAPARAAKGRRAARSPRPKGRNGR